MSGLLPSRGIRWVLLVLACVSAISLFLLATASANTELFAGRYNQLLVLNGALVVLLMLMVGSQLYRLWKNLNHRQRSARRRHPTLPSLALTLMQPAPSCCSKAIR